MHLLFEKGEEEIEKLKDSSNNRQQMVLRGHVDTNAFVVINKIKKRLFLPVTLQGMSLSQSDRALILKLFYIIRKISAEINTFLFDVGLHRQGFYRRLLAVIATVFIVLFLFLLLVQHMHSIRFHSSCSLKLQTTPNRET